MLNQATMDMLTAMKMTAMAAEFANQLKDPTFNGNRPIIPRLAKRRKK